MTTPRSCWAGSDFAVARAQPDHEPFPVSTAARKDKPTAHVRETGLDDDPDTSVIVTSRKAIRNHPLTTAHEEANKLVGR